MNPNGKIEVEGERQDTDRSLRDERKKTDAELISRRQSIQEDADTVVDEARDKADAVLSTAREQADRTLKGNLSPVSTQEEIARARVKEDGKLEEERAIEDERLGKERDDRAHALNELLRLERETTDSHLLIERARTDEALLTRDDLMGMVSHDLQTMLGGIALNAAMMVKEVPEHNDLKIMRRAEGIQRLTARMNRLIGDLVDVASIEAGKLKVTPKLGDAIKLVRESVEAFQPSAIAKKVTLKAEVADESLSAKFDHDRILQVLANLVSNAIKFTPTGGRISVRLDQVEGKVRFAVCDTGPGIESAKHELVFGRFWQADKNDKRGMGLGLYISKCIVEAHDGRLWLESQHGHGSTFYFTLP